ncbi:MAG: aminotransferase class I/II-fold pyridoxal phosphate-dependent enzyme [Phycisphaerales bacterium]|nr:aminotransferase class I/II-fold pyridoxal phosphate-dependent enzyme [Phycisphaerae bacterium]NNF42331.1 aminotransferase class I/II-fold pyridoxal phosphate-dependent enzyme [Phycisphaerales bacterium]NNM26560.1 aminotransferase class I/II-fold pyridoxal phosphate-dependent enzyme [Phycisphaerales bacterium]
MASPTTRSRSIVPAQRTREIKYAVRDVVVLAEEAARAGKEMLYLNIGDPNLFDFAPPAHLVQATVDAMRANRNGYAPSSGLDEARQAIEREADRLGIRSICHTYVTTGASEAIDLALTALADAGDNVLTPSPGYPLYTAVLAKLGVENRPYYLDEDNGWQPDIADIAAKIDDRTRAIVLINPNNPTGTACVESTLDDLITLALDRNLVLFSDEIYDKLLFDGRRHTATAARSAEAKIITFNGLSKSYVVPGFRIGWGVISGPPSELEAYVEAIQKMERARLSANHPEQYAIRPALEADQSHITEMLGRLQQRRDITAERLNAMPGISCVPPQGAFYAFPRIELGVPDTEFCQRVIRETGVVIVPGSGFGQRVGTEHFRVVFLPPEDVLHRAYDRIETVAKSLAG